MLSSEGSREAARKEAAAKRALGEERATEQEGKAASQPASPLKGGAASQQVRHRASCELGSELRGCPTLTLALALTLALTLALALALTLT